MSVEEFVKGKWYKNLGRDKQYIAKFGQFDGSTFITTNREYIVNGKFIEDDGNRLTTNWKDAEECSLEEIQKYLPEGHPDKFLPIEQLRDLINIIIDRAFNNRNIIINKLKEFNTDCISNLPIKYYKEFELFLKSLLKPAPNKEMKVEDLIPGVYYAFEFGVFKYTRFENVGKYFKVFYSDCIWNEYYKQDSYIANADVVPKTCKLATQDEIEWLEKCKELNKYISFEEFKNTRSLKVKDLIVGECYSCKYDDDHSYCFLYENKTTNVKHISLEKAYYSNSGWNFYTKATNLRKASDSEKAQLKECIKQDKYVNIPEQQEQNPLISKEAIERGFVKGAKFFDIVHKEEFVIQEEKFDNFGNSDCLYIKIEPKPNRTNKTACIYKNGVWAKLVKEKAVSLGLKVHEDFYNSFWSKHNVWESYKNWIEVPDCEIGVDHYEKIFGIGGIYTLGSPGIPNESLRSNSSDSLQSKIKFIKEEEVISSIKVNNQTKIKFLSYE